jgi:hypothetical protein
MGKRIPILLFCFLACMAEGAGPKTSLYSAFEAGQFVQYKYRQEDFRYAWRNRAYLDYSTRYDHSPKFRVDMGLGAYLWYNSFPKERNEDVHNLDIKRVSLFISQAQGTYAFGEVAHPLATASLGIFTYKYNADVRNLGEYLFRTGAYPNFILGDFDFPMARLMGVKISNNRIAAWKNDLLLTTETDIWPHFDWTLSYVGSYAFGNVLEVGAGAALTNLIAMRDKATTPHSLKNMYVENLRSDSAVLPGTDIKYEVVVGDTGYYTFKSAKLMARAAFNPQGLFPEGWTGVLGKDDLRIYAELAVLGWKDYPRPTPSDTVQVNSFYSDRMERMPVMLGVNLPAFGWLDLLSLEVEWYGLKGPDSYQRRKEEDVPVPQPVDLWIAKNGSYTDADYRKDDWKWSLHLRKALTPGCDVIAQAARDHVRHDFDSPVQLDREEALTRPGQWWWAVKIQFHP